MSLSWVCHVCNDVRSDSKISVLSRDVSADYGLPAGTMKQNVRYCNDRPACVEAAPPTDLLKKAEP